ncbi:MAG: hypothetical protein HQ595_02445, partial [Candidatus Omnitrophica bacterium]|nr:hypothetical protein [Candidatus Omnitrophota bacterium]
MKLKYILMLSIMLIVQLCTLCASAGSVADFLLELATEHFEEKDYRQALNNLTRVLILEPDNQQAQCLLDKISKQTKTEEEQQMIAALSRPEKKVEPAQTVIVPKQPKVVKKAVKRVVAVKAVDQKKAAIKTDLNGLEQQVKHITTEPVYPRVKWDQPTKILQTVATKDKFVEPTTVKKLPKATTIREVRRESKEVIPEWIDKAMPVALAAEEKAYSENELQTTPRTIARAQPRETITSDQLRSYSCFEAVRLFINSQRIEMDPIIIRGQDIWLALENIAAGLGLAAFYPQEDSLMIIRDDGLPLEFRIGSSEVLLNQRTFLIMDDAVALYQGYAMLSLDSLQQVLDFYYNYSPDTKVLEISKEKEVTFSSFTLKKPKAVLEQEKQLKLAETVTTEDKLPREVRKEFLPKEYQQDIDLKLDSSFRYYKDMLEDRKTRYTEHFLSGKFYDFDVYGHLSARDFETDLKRTFQEDGQHLSFSKDGTTLKLLDNHFRLPRLKSQSVSYWGLEIDSEGEDAPIKHYAWAGRMDPVYVSALQGGGSVKYLGDLYALRQDWIDRDQFSLSATEMYTDSHTEFSSDGGASDYPTRNFLYLLDSDWQVFPELNFYNTLAQCFYTPDNEEEVLISDYDFRSGIELDYERFSLNSGFEYVGDRYASFGIPSSYQDFIGWDVGTSYRVADWFNLGLAGNISRDNVDFDEDAPSAHARGVSASSYLTLPWRQNLNFGWGYNRYLNRGGSDNATGSEYMDYRVDYYKNFDAALAQLGWQHYEMDPMASSTGSMLFDTYSVSFYKSFPGLRATHIRLYQDLTRREELDGAATPVTVTSNTHLSARYDLFPNLSLRGDCRVRNTKQDNAVDTTIMSLTGGAEYKILEDTTLDFTYEASNIDLRDEWSADDWSILFGIRHIFDLGTPEKWGRVRVHVFEDLNGNNIRDAQEQGLENVLAYVVEGAAEKTDFAGRALIERIVPGERKVRLDIRDLSLDMVIKGEVTQQVMVEPLRTAELTFVVVTAGKIEGRIFADMDKNGIFQKDIDIPIPNARIYLLPQELDTLSFSDGSYRFESVYPGQYTVNIDLEWVGEEYKLISSEAKEAGIEPKQKVEGLDFIF